MAVLSGSTAVAAAGTAEQLGTAQVDGPIMVRALKANTQPVYIGNVNGDVDASNGLQLAPGEWVRFDYVENLGSLWVDCTVNGEGVSWVKLWL